MKLDEKIAMGGLSQVLNAAKERAKTLECLRKALLEDNEKKIKFYAYKICGLNYESNRISESIDP